MQAYTCLGLPSTMALTRFTFGFQVRLERLWEWLTLMPKAISLPQNSHFAICEAPPFLIISLCSINSSSIVAEPGGKCKLNFSQFSPGCAWRQLPPRRGGGQSRARPCETHVPPHFFGLAQRNGCGAPKKNALAVAVGGRCLLRLSAFRWRSSRRRMALHTAGRGQLRFARAAEFEETSSLPCRAGEVAPAEQAPEGCWRFAPLTKGAQTFGTPPAALARVHLPYNVGEAQGGAVQESISATAAITPRRPAS